MKTTITLRSLFAALLVCAFALFLGSSIASAQDAAAAADTSAPFVSPDTAAAIATPFIVTLAIKAPWILTVLAAIGGFRFFFKPIVSLLEAYVRSTPQKTDDEFYEKATHSRWFKILAWLLDFAFSVKIGSQFTAKPEGPK